MWRSSTDAGGERRPVRTPDYVTVGTVLRPHGVRGEVRVAPVDTDVERLLELPAVYCSPPKGGERRRFTVRRARADRGAALLALEGVDTRNAAEGLRGWRVEIPGAWVKPLPPDHYYVFELVGCRVETASGRHLGKVVEVLPTGANDVYVVEDEGGRQVLIPAVRAWIKEVDVAAGRIVVDLWPGLIDDDEGDAQG